MGYTGGIIDGMNSVKTAISMPADLFRRVEKLCEKMGVSRSKFFALAAEELLEKNRKQRLIEKINEAWKDGLDEEDERFLRSSKHMARVLWEDESW